MVLVDAIAPRVPKYLVMLTPDTAVFWEMGNWGIEEIFQGYDFQISRFREAGDAGEEKLVFSFSLNWKITTLLKTYP